MRISGFLGLLVLAAASVPFAACGGYSAPAGRPVPLVTANFLVLSSSASGHLPDAVEGSPYGYGFQTNIGLPGVKAVAPIAWHARAALPPGMTLSSQGALAGTPTSPGTFTISVEAVDSTTPTPLTADFVYLMNVRAPGATLTSVAHSDLGGQGQNGDITVATATATKRAYAYIGTRGRAGECPASGVKVVDLSQITNPQVVAHAGAVSGAAQQEVSVITGVSSPGFHPGGSGDLMAVTEQPCDPNSATAAQTGVEFFDVSDPTHPLLLGNWDSGVQGASDAVMLPVAGPADALGQVDHSQDRLYALVAVPTSETSGAGKGDFRVLDITNPAAPAEVRNFGVLAATAIALPQAVQGVDQRVFLDSIKLSDDRTTAYLSYWDEGVVVLDVRDPLAISSTNPAVLLDHIQYPVTSLATTSTPSNPEGNTHMALPVLNDSALLIADQVCASSMVANPSNPSQTTPQNPAVNLVCGAGSAVPLTNNAGWGFLRSYTLPTTGTATLSGFFTTPQAESDPAPDLGIYTAHDLAWNGNIVHPHGYVAWMSSGVEDLDLTSVAPPTLLASFAPPDTPDPNGDNPAVNNPAKAMVFGVAAYSANGQPYILASDINSGLWIVQESASPQLAILTTTLPDGNVGVPYTANLDAINGTLGPGKLVFRLAANSNPLPSGLSLDQNGNLTGTPQASGTVDVTFAVDDGAGNTSNQTISMTIAQTLAIVAPAAVVGTVNEAFTETLTAVNGTAPYTFSLPQRPLPSGLSLSAAGVITGLTGSVNTSVPVQVTDSSVPAQTATILLPLQILPLTVSGTNLPRGAVGAAYASSILFKNGTGPFAPGVIQGSLPAGLTMAADQTSNLSVVIQGTPTAAGISNFTVQATDADGQSTSQAFSITVDPFEVTPPVLDSAVEGRGYLATLGAQGGTAPFTFNVVLGALPAGLSLDINSGQIAGVPAAGTAGTANFTVQVKDANGLIANSPFSLVVFSTSTFAITTAALPPATAGQNFQQSLAADFGTTPYKFSLLRGSLPAGVTLDATGNLSGVPAATGVGSYAFTAQATDATGLQATRNFTWTVLPPSAPH